MESSVFRERHDVRRTTVLRVAAALFVAMVIAGIATGWLLIEIRKEQRALDAIIRGGVAEDIERLGSLPEEVSWQFGLTLLVLGVLVVTGTAYAIVARAYLKSEQSLQDIKQLAWEILSSMDQGVMTIDNSECVTNINPHALELLNQDASCIGRPLADLFAPSGHQRAHSFVEASRSVLASGKGIHDCDCTVSKDGHSLRLEADCHVLRDREGEIRGTVLHIRDVTERVLLDERMRRMERFLGVGSLVAGLHHEIKNPLSALSLHVQLLAEGLEGRADAETTVTLKILNDEIKRITNVLEAFRTYASSERLILAETDVIQLCQRMIGLTRPKAEAQNVNLSLEMPQSEAIIASLDASRFEQVLLNLVLNALEALPDGGEIRTSISTNPDDDVVVEVSDNGHGIPENVRSRIFDPYFTTKSDGSGMGLAVCDKIIRLHGGRIDIDTSQSGTSVRLIIPRTHAQSAAITDG